MPAPGERAYQPASAKFELADYIKPQLLTPDLAGETTEQVIRELLGMLDQAGLLADPEAAAEAVLDREAQMSTGMAEGLAVPHGRTDAVDGLVCAVGVRRDGIDAGAAHGEVSRIFVLVLTPLSGAGPYLQFVAAVISSLDSPGRQRVLAAETPEQLRAALIGEKKA